MNQNLNQFSFVSVYDEVPKIEEKINEWRKKFSKFDVGISYSSKPIKKSIQDFQLVTKEVDALEFTVTIEIPLLKHEGWEYQATLESVAVTSEDEKSVEYETQIFSPKPTKKDYKDTEFKCDHCHSNRNRKTVHIFEHETSKEERIIGSTCVKEYFGINVEIALKKMLNLYGLIESFIEESEGFYCGGRQYLDSKTYSKYVYATIKSQGKYVSRSMCDDFNNEIPTSARAYNDMFYDPKSESDKQSNIALFKLAENFDYSKAKEYWFAKEDDSDFIHNVQVSLRMLNPKLGFIAYAVWEYMREVEDFTGKKKLAEKAKNSQYVGNIGDKVKDFKVEVIKKINFESQYGPATFVKMLDENGNIIMWKTSPAICEGMEENQNYKIKGTIKRHEEFRGDKQTFLSRCKFERIN